MTPEVRKQRQAHRREMWENRIDGLNQFFTITIDDARDFLKYYNSRYPVSKQVAIQDIEDAVCQVYDINRYELHQKTRKRPYPEARYVAMYFMRKQLKLTQQQIAERFHLDRTSVIAAVCEHNRYTSSIPNRLQYDGDLRAKVDAVGKLIGGEL